MASTKNQSATGSWTLVSSSAGTVSINFVGVPLETAVTASGTNAPAETIRGHRVTSDGQTVTISGSERLWVRTAQNIPLGEDGQVVITEG